MENFINHLWQLIQAAAAPVATRLDYAWNNGIWGHEIKGVMLLCIYLAAAFLLRRPIAWIIITWLHHISRRVSDDWLNGQIVMALRGPIRALPIWIGLALGNEALQLLPRQEAIADHIIASMGAGILFWAFLVVLRPWSKQLMRLEGKLTRPMISWMAKGLRVVMVIIAFAAILNIWGIQIGPILTGLGLLGAAVALGAQDLFKNLIAGVMILTERRFDLGDWISVENVVEGDVERIGFRSTLVRRLDNAAVYVPNTKLADDAVINISRMKQRRIMWTIGLEYKVSLDQIEAVCRDLRSYIADSPDFVAMNQTRSFVGLDKFAESAIDILIVCFTNKVRWADYVEVKAALGAKVKETLERHSVNFAFPSRTVFVEGTGANPSSAIVAQAAGAAG